MNHFTSIRELFNVLSRGSKLLAEMFEKRSTLSYKYEYALEIMNGNEDVIKLLLNKNIIRQNGNLLELDDQFLKFFEDILEVNEEINTSYINENIRQIKDEYMMYYLQSTNDSERYKYLKAVKSSLRKIGRITIRNIVDLDRNIENTFKTEPNYKIKLSKLENHKLKLEAIEQMIVQTENLLHEDAITFFKTATDEELRYIKTDLLLSLLDSRQNLIETRKQIIEYINQVKYQSKFIEKLKQLKYLRDQYEIKHKTNIKDILSESRALVFEPNPSYSLKLSLDRLQQDDVYELIRKVRKRYQTGITPHKIIAEDFSEEELASDTEEKIYIDLYAIKDKFAFSGKHLFEFILNCSFQRELTFDERITIYCQMVSIFDEELEITDKFGQNNNVEYALVYYKHN